MKAKIKKLIAVLLLVALLIPSVAFATDSKGSLTAVFADKDCIGEPVEFAIYRIAVENNQLLAPFKDYPVEIDMTNSGKWLDVAETLKGLVRRDALTPSFKATMGSNGTFMVPDMPHGTYLVVGSDFTKENTKYEVQPFLIPVPCLGYQDAAAVVKVKKTEIPETKTVIRKVLKVWNDNGSRKRPDSIAVDLLQDGFVYDTVELSKDNNWRYTWSDLPAGHEWLVVEDVPSGYTTSTRLDGITFVIRNKLKTPTYHRDPPPEDDRDPCPVPKPTPTPGRFPQSGVLWWPVALIAGAGCLCFIGSEIVPKNAEGEEDSHVD